MERAKTGIAGLDDMLGGGLINGRSYLVAGGPGAGKTILCMQFLLQGVQEKEKGLYIALEEQGSEITQDMAQFGWDLRNIKIVDTIQEPETGIWSLRSDSVVSKPELSLSNLIKLVDKKLATYNAKRIVIDSLTSIKMLYDHQTAARKEVLSLMNFLNKSGCTSLLTVESSHGGDVVMEEFLASGSIKLHTIEKEGETVSAVSIEKMRGMPFDRHIRPMKITDKGIEIFSKETLFS